MHVRPYVMGQTSVSRTGSLQHRRADAILEEHSVRKAVRQIMAGGFAGLVVASLMHPLDVIKTRFQLQRGTGDYTSMADCVKKMFKSEGPFSLYKGILPPLLSEIPVRSTKFFSFETYKSLFVGMDLHNPQWTVLAGLGSGLTEGIIITPFDRVKVHLQAQRNRIAEQPSTWRAARHIVINNGYGVNGLMKGLTATMSRHGAWNSVYFGSYHNLKAQFDDENLSGICKLTMGFMAGSAATITNTPFDVAKSRIQGPQPPDDLLKYKDLLRTLSTMFREEGYLALYKGLVPRLLRFGPGGAIMMFVYEQASTFFMNIGI